MASDDSAREGIYNALVSVRNTELSVYYTRYNIQAVINFGLIAAVLASRQDSMFLSPLSYWVIIGGVALSLIWLGFAVVGKRLFTERWEKYIRQYERDVLAPQKSLQMFTQVEEMERNLDPWKRNWKNLNVLTRSVPIIAVAAWILIAWSSLYLEPLEGRLSRLETAIAKLQKSPEISNEITRRLDDIAEQLREILKQLPSPSTTSVPQVKSEPTQKPGPPR